MEDDLLWKMTFGKYDLTIFEFGQGDYGAMMPNHILTSLHTPLCRSFEINTYRATYVTKNDNPYKPNILYLNLFKMRMFTKTRQKK